MRSPFPGMDPYIEGSGLWPDFHSSFLIYLRDAITALLPENYEARIEERMSLVALELPPEQGRPIRPDLAIERRGRSTGSASKGTAAMLTPVTLPLQVRTEEVRETWIEIYHRPEHELVAVL